MLQRAFQELVPEVEADLCPQQRYRRVDVLTPRRRRKFAIYMRSGAADNMDETLVMVYTPDGSWGAVKLQAAVCLALFSVDVIAGEDTAPCCIVLRTALAYAQL